MNIQEPAPILVATDGSDRALGAAHFLRVLLDGRPVHRITALAVIPPIATAPFLVEAQVLSGMSIGRETLDALTAAAEQDARQALDAVARELDGLALRMDTIVRVGSPAEEIVQAAEELGAGLIVVGSHGWGLARSILLDSVSERVLHRAHCAVLVVRPPAHDSHADPARHLVRGAAEQQEATRGLALNHAT